jgi:lipid II:glycine glycyltransferase (peptidoglycan interpeptide bridge formation enzyme)
MLSIDVVTDQPTWDEEVLALGGHPLQLWGWGELKAAHGWRALRLRVVEQDDSAAEVGEPRTVGLAQVLVRPLPSVFRALSYVARGPVVVHEADRARVCDAVADHCRTSVRGVGITFEPDWDADDAALDITGGRVAENPILYPETLIVDLTQSEDKLQAVMSKSTRYDIRKAGRSGLDVRRVTDEETVKAVLGVYHETAERAGFALHTDEYYLDIHRLLGEHSVVVAAFDDDGSPVAFVWCISSATTSFELYGGINDRGRKLRANAPVKWESMMEAKRGGLSRYDMNGLLNDGISDFKRSFAQHTDTLVGSIDVPFSFWYSTWNRALPTAKKVLRSVSR